MTDENGVENGQETNVKRKRDASNSSAISDQDAQSILKTPNSIVTTATSMFGAVRIGAVIT